MGSTPLREFRRRLDSWKDIGAYFGRDARTVQRWEKTLGLPVHRQLNEKGGSVYAYTDQLDAWRESRTRLSVAPVEPESPSVDRAEGSTGQAERWNTKRNTIWWMASAALCCGVGVFLWSRPEKISFHPVPFTSLVGSEVSPSFSPDGRQVAFAWSSDDAGFGIFIKSIDVGRQDMVVEGRGSANCSPVWSPDGTSIAYLSGLFPGRADLWIKKLATGEARKVASTRGILAPLSRGLAWMPDGKSLVGIGAWDADEETSLFRISAITGISSRLTKAPPGFSDFYPDVSPDGGELVFTRVGGGLARLYRMRLDGSGTIRPLLPKQTENTPSAAAVWDSHGGLLAEVEQAGSTQFWRSARFRPAALLGAVPGVVRGFAINREGTLVFSQAVSDVNLWAFPLSEKGASGPPHRCDELNSTHDETNPRYSPDGMRVAFESARSGHPEVWLIDRDGKNAEAITNFNGPVTGSPSWSPDGQWIAFDSRVEGHAAIFIVRSTGGPPRRVTKGMERSVVPSWSRDGKRIYFSSPADGTQQVFSIHPDGSGRMQVTRQGGFYALESPDGRFLYYTKAHEQITAIKRVPISGGDETDVAEGVFERSFAVASRGIYFATAPLPKPKLEFLAFNQSKPTFVGWFPKAVLYGLGVSPDGKELMYGETDTLGIDLQRIDHMP